MLRVRALAAVIVLLAAAHLALVGRARSAGEARALALHRGGAIARALLLTDLAVWTEARYTRHPALADRGTAFQDHPGSLEHFPAGSVVVPPPHLLPGAPGRTAP